MAENFTYILSNDVGKVRLELADTDPDYFLFNDAEINAKLTTEGTVLDAASALCYILAAKYSRRPDFSVDGQLVKSSQIAKAYAERGKELRERSVNAIGVFIPERADGYTDDIAADSNTLSLPVTDPLAAGNDFDAGRLWP